MLLIVRCRLRRLQMQRCRAKLWRFVPAGCTSRSGPVSRPAATMLRPVAAPASEAAFAVRPHANPYVLNAPCRRVQHAAGARAAHGEAVHHVFCIKLISAWTKKSSVVSVMYSAFTALGKFGSTTFSLSRSCEHQSCFTSPPQRRSQKLPLLQAKTWRNSSRISCGSVVARPLVVDQKYKLPWFRNCNS